MKHRNETIERLRQITLFSACTNDELALIAARMNEHRASAGDVLATEGQIGRKLPVITAGKAEVSSQREFTELITGAPALARKLLIGLARRLRTADLGLTS